MLDDGDAREDEDAHEDDDDEFGLGEVIKGLWTWIQPHWLSAAALGACLTAHLASTLAIALSLEWIVDEVVPNRDAGLLATVVGIMVGILLLSFLASVLQARLIARLSARVLADIQRALFEQVMRVSQSYFRRTERGDILAHFSSDIASISEAVGEAAPYMVMYTLMLVGCIGAIAWIDWRAGLLTLALLPLGALLNHFLGAPATKAIRDYKTREGEVLSTAEEAVRAHVAIHGFGLHGFFRNRFGSRTERKMAQHARASFLVHMGEMAAEYGTMLLLAVGLTGGAWLALSGHMSAGALVAMFTLLLYIQDAASEIATAASELIEAGGGLERVQKFLEEPAEDAGDPDAMAAPLEREIRLDTVDFCYEPGDFALKDVSITIRRGETVALVGRSGSGKSTVLNLLLRFLTPSAGHLTWDGVDMRDVSRQALRAQMGIVFQEPLMIRATIAEIVKLGRPDASDADVEQAIRAAALDEVIAELPEGRNTIIGEGGQSLSGGQRQRLALAQALIRDASLLVLDEATSALDPETEARIADTLDALPEGRTVLSVTHRMNLAQRADRIVLLADGRVAEEGSHDELMLADGLYARMVERQSGFTLGVHGDIVISPNHLRHIPLLSELSADHLETLSEAFVTTRYEPGTMVVREGDRGDGFYIIYRGQLEARVGDEIVAVLEDGDHFGEIALVLNMPRTASIVARTSAICLRLTREAFDMFMSSNEDLKRSITKAAEERLASVRTTQGNQDLQ